MKNYFKLLNPILLAFIAISSCAKDNEPSDSPSSTENNITVDGTTYQLQSVGRLEDYGSDDGSDSSFIYQGTNFDLYLMTKEFGVIFSPDGFVDSAYGSGLLFYFETFSSNSNRLGNGSYKYQENSPYPSGTFDWGFYANPDGSIYVELTNGTFDVSSNGSSYSIAFNLTDENGKKITGNFNGILDLVDLK